MSKQPFTIKCATHKYGREGWQMISGKMAVGVACKVCGHVKRVRK
jgi:hypothetical protein